MQDVFIYGERQQSTSMSQQRKNRRRERSADARHPFKIVGYSLACERHPIRNEDTFLIDKASGLIAVFDGVGGSAAGQNALHSWKRARSTSSAPPCQNAVAG